MKDLTQGSVSWHLLRMSGAFQLNLIVSTLLSLANIYWLGYLGATAQAAVTLAGIPMMLLLSLLPIVNVGAGILIAQAAGAGDRARANELFNEAFGTSLAIIALLGAVAWTCRDRVGLLLTSDPEVAASIARYFRWFVPSIVIQVPMFVLSGALSFAGNVRASVIAQTGMVVLNALLTPVWIFGWFGLPAMGLEGSAFATFVACSIVMLALLIYLVRQDSYLVLRPQAWLKKPRALKDALKIGLPVGIEGAIAATYLLAIAVLIRSFGADQQAAFGIGQRVFQLALIPLIALSSATSVLAGHNHGAAREDRVREAMQSSLTLGLVIAPILVGALEYLAPWICSGFSDDAGVVAAGTTFLRIVGIGLIPTSIAFAVFAVLSGMGNTRSSLYAQIASAALIVIVCWILSLLPGFESAWMWWTLVAANGLQAILAWHFARRQFDPRPQSISADSIGEGATP